ncbi:MAG: PLP-dependent aminotransferase family protein [Acidobacteria bacterium]|nr:PLP-dependent aminotransferase family protein [Acidobacteriota bacterium]
MQIESLLSADARNLRPSAIRKFAAMMNDPAIISFAGGAPSPATFPAGRIAHFAEKVVRDTAATSLQYGPTRGLPALRDAVASICRERGFACDPATQLLMTTGSQQALYLVSATLLDPGDVVLVELPTYIGGAGAFYARRAELVGVAQDDDGIVPAALEETATRLRAEGRRIKFLYTIPNFQNPSGRVLAAERRRDVLELAKRFDFLVVEDDPYGELCFADDLDTTPIKTSDDEQRVIYLGSFSKVLSPGLRTGWIVGEPALVRQFELTKESADLCSGMLDEAIIAAFCAAGELPEQIKSVRAFYRDRRDALLGALDEHFTGRATWTRTEGGLFTFVTLNDERDTAELLPPAVERGVAFIPGGAFFVDGSGANTMRLTFAKETDDRMREGIRRVAELFFAA